MEALGYQCHYRCLRNSAVFAADEDGYAGRNWRTSPMTQVTWGLQYIAVRYGTACQAWTFRISHGWY